MNKVSYTILIVVIFVLSIIRFCCPNDEKLVITKKDNPYHYSVDSLKETQVKIKQNVLVEDYFEYVDSIVCKYDSITTYPLTEHLLVRANPWIIDTLKNTDYYVMKARDSFVYDQKKMIVLPKGSSLKIPDSIQIDKLLHSFDNTSIDVNIPEFKLRIYEDSVKLYEFTVRVGRNEKKYLKMSDRIQDLKTKTGEGTIVNHVLDPRYVNPANNHEYFVTNRDDKKVTKLPQIPFIETELNGIRHGQLIHPTTNPITLGKSYSNGCIGTSEADAWIIYYYAPISTKIIIRYDLQIVNDEGEEVLLKDIYKYK